MVPLPHCLPQLFIWSRSRLNSRLLFQNKNCAFYLLSCLPPGHKGDIPFVVISQVLGVLGQLDSLTKLGRLDLNRLLLNIVCLHNSEKALVSNLFSSIKRAQVRATDEPEIVLKGQLSRLSNNTFFLYSSKNLWISRCYMDICCVISIFYVYFYNLCPSVPSHGWGGRRAYLFGLCTMSWVFNFDFDWTI